MHAVNTAPDRTTKQPLKWACMNPECWEDGQRYEFKSDQPKCPKCKAEDHPMVLLLSLLHFLVNSEAGPIRSGGKRLMIACDPKRTTLATATNQEAMTGQPTIVNCPECRKFIEKNHITKPVGKSIVFG